MSDNQTFSRRKVLKSVGAASTGAAVSGGGLAQMGAIGAVDARSEPADRVLRFEATGQGTYDVSVTGLLQSANDVTGSVSKNTATGTLQDEVDEYTFSGEIVSIDTSKAVTVYVDGKKISKSDIFSNTITIKAAGSTGEFDLSVSGGLLTERGPAADGHRVSGRVSNKATYRYSGEITYLDVPEDTKIRVNGEKRTEYTALGIDVPDELTLRGLSNGVTKYDIEFMDVSQVRAGPSLVDRPAQKPIDSTQIDGKVGSKSDPTHPNGPDTLLYGGRVKRISPDGGPTVTINARESTLTVGGASESGTYTIAAQNGISEIGAETSGATVSGTVDDESVTYQYEGRLQRIQLGGVLRVDFAPDEYRDSAVTSKKLQLHARMERWESYEEFKSKAESDGGYLRRDPNGLIASNVTGELFDQTVPKRLVVTSDLAGDTGAEDASATLARDTEADTLARAVIRYRELLEGGEKRITVHDAEAAAGGDRVATPLQFTTDTHVIDPSKFDPDGTHNQSDYTLEDGIDYITGATMSAINSILSTASDYIDSNAVSKMWDLKMTSLDTLYALAESGLLQEMTDGDGNIINCAGCVGTVKAFIQGGVCGYAADYACTVLTVSGPGAIGCIVFAELLCAAIDEGIGGSEAAARWACNYEQLNAC
ncbi:hypothetical protein ACFQL9_13445 [Halobaculum lipolyticum]|uniref:Uncharacterized protein n=1 Tax=Halobaculum lipolyticum TaxID=3032001 RepID=A0ABD5WFY1_9EURY